MNFVTNVYEKAEKKSEDKTTNEQPKEQQKKQQNEQAHPNLQNNEEESVETLVELTPEQIKEQEEKKKAEEEKRLAEEEKKKAEQARAQKNRTDKINRYNSKLRNFLHVAEFMSLSFFAALFLFILFMRNKRKYMLASALFALLYAFSDEIHQIFVDGRTFEVRDLILDSAGISAGVILACSFFLMIKKILVVKNS